MNGTISTILNWVWLSILLLSFNNSAAQSFTKLYGGPLAEMGTSIVLNDSVYIIGEKVFNGTLHEARIDLVSTNGDSLYSTLVDLGGALFLQASAPIPGGGAYLVGSIISPGEVTHDGLLIRVGPDNLVSWITHPDVSGDQHYFGAVTLPDGGALLCGINATTATRSALVTRFTQTGATVWNTEYSVGIENEAFGISVDDNSVTITGRQLNFGGTSDVFFHRLDLNGNALWTTSWGGNGNESGRALVYHPNGSYIMAGTTTSFGVFDASEQRIKQSVYLHGFNELGDTLWTRTYGDTLFDRSVFCMVVAANGDLLIGGSLSAIKGTSDGMLLRLTALGDPVWERILDEGKEERILGIDALSDGLIASGWVVGDEGFRTIVVRRDVQGN